MDRRPFGRTGLSTSLLGFGGSEIGFGDAPQQDVDAILNRALDAGLNVIDTAECYRASEVKIGRAVSSRRSEYHLFTKAGHAVSLPGEEPLEGGDWDPVQIAQSIDRSLKRLNTDYLDLIQLHTCSLEMLKKGDVIEPLQRAKEQGKTRLIGYSGDSQEARWAVESGLFDTLQTSCSIADQECIDLALPLAQEKGMGVIIKRPLANAAWLRMEGSEGKYWEEYVRRLKVLDYEWLSGPDAASTALRFTAACPGVGTMIVGTANPDRWMANAALLEQGPLPSEEYDAVRRRWKERAAPDWVGQN